MNTRIKFLTFLLIAPLALFAQDIEISGESGDYIISISKRFEVDKGGTLSISRINADVKVDTKDNPFVVIRESIESDAQTKKEAERIADETIANYKQNGSNISIQDKRRGFHGDRILGVTVPETFNVNCQLTEGDLSANGLKGNVSIQTANGDVTLANIAGSVDLQTASGDVKLDEISGAVRAQTAAGNVELQGIYADARINSAGGDMRVKNIKGQLKITTAGGDIELSDVENDLNARTAGGDITATHINGRAGLSTMGGTIRLQHIKGEVTADSKGGSIQGNDIGSRIRAHTLGGIISLQNVRGPVDAKTMGGDVEVEMTLQDFKKPHAIDLETMGGNITLSLPEKLPATIRAEIRIDPGKNMFKRFDIYSDFPLSKSSPDEFSRSLTSTGEINGGGDLVDLKANGGNITIKKQ